MEVNGSEKKGWFPHNSEENNCLEMKNSPTLIFNYRSLVKPKNYNRKI